MVLKKYSNVLTSGSWSTKYPKDSQILALVGVSQKLMNDSKKISEKSNWYFKKDKQPISGILCLGCWNIQKWSCETRPTMENNTGVASNTAL